ncbi:hypothetical protein BO78DRAFT_453324 [Aspergillus sclerotiicarbonarius CBS 121057]|uniref:Terpenoid synthase n=1 Tax=Aspergillus sclerotiicarbonarius (strain CBS 121057 / IBT 28362) TaxID=1448318 RepID=A0A319DY60_ASPSB|nr:hypothetical protein BO78DRAFT_453324 [Aspergillus sclerotiicarbonarius CBS 121057]
MKVNFFSLLSSPEFECLNFHDINSLSHEEKQTISQHLHKPLSLFLQSIGYKHHSQPPDPSLRHDLQAFVHTHPTPLFPTQEALLQRLTHWAAECAEYTYAACGPDTKLTMAIITIIFLVTDDSTILPPEDRTTLSYFSFNHYQNLPPSSRWSTVLSHGPNLCTAYFGSRDPLLGAMAGNSYTAFVDGCARELRMENHTTAHILNHGEAHPGTEVCAVEAYPSYLRFVTGTTVLFLLPIFKTSRDQEMPSAVWIPLVPAISRCINHLNDLLSSPKEVLAGESWNYLSLRTKVMRQAGRLSLFGTGLWTFRDRFYEVLEEGVRTVGAVDRAFAQCISVGKDGSMDEVDGGDGGGKSQGCDEVRLAGELWTAFKHGHIAWHLNCQRYGLESLSCEG